MNNYILDKLRADSSHLIDSSKNEEKISHNGLRGRFRELLINNILIPWLPPYVRCGTGTIIATENKIRESTQDDIIIYDLSINPPVLVSDKAPEGVFLYNSVLVRIEVKSTLNREGLREFCTSSQELSKMNFSAHGITQSYTGCFNILFAYKSDSKGDEDFELKRLFSVMKELNINVLSGIVSAICVVGKGFWKLGRSQDRLVWQRLDSDRPEDHIVWFVGTTSNSCFDSHLSRQGRDRYKSLEGGIGTYLNHPFIDCAYDEG